MKGTEKIRAFITDLDRKEFYTYLGVVLGVLTLITFFMIVRYYSKVNALQKRLVNINELREDAQQVFEKAHQVEQQRKEVDAMLSADEDFKIVGFFEETIVKLGLGDKKKSYRPSRIARDDKYEEVILNTSLVDMSMKQLCELLNELEKKERIYTKELDIIKSQKTPRSLEVNLTIATLQPRAK